MAECAALFRATPLCSSCAFVAKIATIAGYIGRSMGGEAE